MSLWRFATAAVTLFLMAAGVSTGAVRIGYGNSPPMAYRDARGQPRGFMVDVLNEAARREDIAIEWVPGTAVPPDVELRTGTVDIIPAGVIDAARRERFWVSTPWWSSDMIALVRAGGVIHEEQDLAGHRVAVPIAGVTFAQEHHPSALLPAGSAVDATARMCEGNADAAIIADQYVRELLQRLPDSCRSVSIQTLDLKRGAEYAVVARWEKADEARRLRSRIDEIARDGTLLRLAVANPPVSTPQAASLSEALRNQYQRRTWSWGLGAMAALLLFTTYFLIRQHRSRMQLRNANERLKESTAALHDNEMRFRALVTASSEVLYLMSPDWSYMRQLKGSGMLRDTATLSATWLRDFIPPDDQERVMAAVHEAIRNRSLFRLEHKVLRVDGSVGWMLSRAVPVIDGHGQLVEWFGAATDVTDAKHSEEALQDALRLNQQIIDSAREGIIVYGPDLRYRVWNRYMEELTGIPASDVLGRLPAERFPFLENVGITEKLRSALQGEAPRPIDFFFTLPNGRSGWASDLSGPLRSPAGAIVGVLATVRDISERKQSEEERAKLQAQVLQAQKMESIGRLAGGVAHDFNNLLTVINGYSGMALASLANSDPLRAQMEQIAKAGERATALTRQLLAFSRKQVLQPRTLELNEVVEDLHRMVTRLVGEDIEVRIRLSVDKPVVHADPVQLEQVILNLAVNARDAMPDGGRLSIETGIVELATGDATLGPEGRPGRYATLVVRDTGVGMDEATRKRMFEPFFTTKPVGKGTGLGLSMVQGIVGQSGGFVDVESEPGKGTTFRIHLPAVAPARNAPSETSRAARPARGHETILVVEDEAEVRRYAVLVLESCGYRVIQAALPSDALRVFEEEGSRIDLVLTDVVMPQQSGRELVEEVRKRRPGTKVLFMSGYSDEIVARHGILEEGLELIQKPFSPDELASRVRAVLGKPAAMARVLVSEEEAAVRTFLRTVLEGVGYEVLETADGDPTQLFPNGARDVDLVVADLAMTGDDCRCAIEALRRQAPSAGIIAVCESCGGESRNAAQALGAEAVLGKPLNPGLLVATAAEVLRRRK